MVVVVAGEVAAVVVAVAAAVAAVAEGGLLYETGDRTVCSWGGGGARRE